MQYIVFSIQAGIDNVELSNLIDHAANVWPADVQNHWRLGKSLIPNKKTPSPPFWTSPNNLFYSNTPTYKGIENYVLNPAYKEMIKTGKNTVIPVNLAHFWTDVDSYPFGDLLKTDVCAIYVYSNNRARLYEEISYNLAGPDLERARENIMTVDPLDQNLWSTLYPPGFNAVIEMERAWSDWDYLNGILTGIGIDLPKIEYDRYLSTFKRP